MLEILTAIDFQKPQKKFPYPSKDVRPPAAGEPRRRQGAPPADERGHGPHRGRAGQRAAC